jgi:alanyl-tRNA synthetase
MVNVLVKQMGSSFPELSEQKDLISKVIHEEEENFLRTLEKGISRLSQLMKAAETKILDESSVFELYDTFGFPVDLTALIASESDMSVDHEGFSKALEEQKDRSRAAGKIEAEDWIVLFEDAEEEFIGYDSLTAEVRITQYRSVKSKGKKLFQLVFNLTPFYAEGGGQVGDTGYIESDGKRTMIINTVRENNQIIHVTETLPANPAATFQSFVTSDRRENTMRNHSATHLLHEALREVLGSHVEQKGSLVHPDYLRFDFSHFAKVTDEELARVESIVNEHIRSNLELEETRQMPLSEARNLGAMMLFGEKYGDVVRVIRFGESVELCGGTHVSATGNIGIFKITTETAVAAGIRRIEAISGEAASSYFNDRLQQLNEVKSLLKNPRDIVKAVEDLLEKHSALNKELEKVSKGKTKDIKESILDKVSDVNGVKFLAEKLDLGPSEVKDLAFQLRNENPDLFAVFGSLSEGKAILTVVISDDLVSSKNLHAGNIIRELAKEIQGGGGGQAFFATAGGKNVDGIDSALKNAINFLS